MGFTALDALAGVGGFRVGCLVVVIYAEQVMQTPRVVTPRACRLITEVAGHQSDIGSESEQVSNTRRGSRGIITRRPILIDGMVPSAIPLVTVRTSISNSLAT